MWNGFDPPPLWKFPYFFFEPFPNILFFVSIFWLQIRPHLADVAAHEAWITRVVEQRPREEHSRTQGLYLSGVYPPFRDYIVIVMS